MNQKCEPIITSSVHDDLLQQALLDVFDTADDGIALLDKEGRFLYLNHRHLEIFGYTHQNQLLGGTWHQLYDKDGVQWFESFVMPQFSKAGYWRGECKARKIDGSMFDEDIWLKALPDGNMACFCRDITRVKEIEKQSLFNLKLKENLEEMEERLLLFTSHELRAPLGGIGLIADYLAEYHERLERDDIMRHVFQISQFVGEFRDLLDAFYVFQNTQEASRQKISTSPVTICKFIERIASLTAKRYGKNTVFKIIGDEKETIIHTDETLLKHIIQNLLSNAAKYSPPASLVYIKITKCAQFTTIVVTDPGIGIPKDEQKRIYEFMYRASNSKYANGSGLGLALVKQCLATLKGTMNIESELNCGTTITITLPLIHSYNE
ncbi:MAG: PAS domain-containing sensor histidine kinase [Opitutales bacterium]|jgi:PAS domain S-box-containing protein|nr:PAS domain-containing sensor histidine kinase [Opitutales bacterium]MDP4643711.1 PAS domain-containing sensor histidine kinase [Opitutales bacterium]MDP4777450.1 PAS domain-containing sensor histidine kinase [Opitutales bacterium]MDP4884166.1 PAS domain-containing sensor histidine kinase [Opitutales bacterium]MDP5079507.1 PAS domain-containing sensor histidine kinase [Opitutales bacterium]